MTSADSSPSPLALLSSDEGRALLARLPDYDEDQLLPLTARLREEGVPPELVSAALTQSRLRSRARTRLGPVVDRLLLTADGVEQATRPQVARRHARRFLDAGVERVWDLGCGLGLDSLALAEAGLAVTAVERDPEVAAAARANLAPYPRAEVLCAEVDEVSPGPQDGVWFDPARRTPGVADITGRTRRVWRLSELSPTWEQVQEVAARVRAAGAKLSPGFAAQDLPPGAEAEWVSVEGDVVECAVWWGAAVDHPGTSAVVGRGPDWHLVRPAASAPASLGSGAELGPFLGEPDKAVLAADLAGAAAEAVDGRELAAGVGYVSASAPVQLPWMRWYAVEQVLPLHARSVRAALRERGAGRVTIKKRGVATDPERFRAELRLKKRPGPEVVLVLTTVGATPQALVVSPLGPDA
ncbi:THUMP-like domain-containing protein [Ornithinimicrobium panacihumi]|uniref:class I SAM-dependent methyltransferase n=1 Tax=Ornithinimicrobium panacihumi TaxID=2008449 RepID=UPI003F8B813A